MSVQITSTRAWRKFVVYSPVWLDSLAYYLADGWCRLVFRTPFLDRRCWRCGETRYNHVSGRFSTCIPSDWEGR